MPELPAFHGWTHRPKEQGGTDPIAASASTPMQWSVFYKETDQAITTGTATAIIFDKAGASYWRSSDSFASLGSAKDAHDAGLTTTTSMYNYVTGIFWAGCFVEWETGNYVKRSFLQISDDHGDDTGKEPFFGFDFGGSLTSTPRGAQANMVLTQDTFDTARPTYHKDQDLWMLEGAPAVTGTDTGSRWRVVVKHSAGSNRNVTGAKLSVLWMGADVLA